MGTRQEGGGNNLVRSATSSSNPSPLSRTDQLRRTGDAGDPRLGRKDGQATAAGRSGRTAADHRLSAEGTDDPAAHTAAAVGDAFRGVRSWRVHAKRPILCALALGGHP